VLGAARFAGLAEVIYTSNKAPRAWKGTPAEGMVNLDALTESTVFFTGNAREAALAFPQNANVAAAVALAGLGFENTRVQLCANPQATGNRHRIQAHGAFGEIDVSILGKTLPENPKTSVLAPYSLVRSLANLAGTVVVA
jgi:aspartate dehydrogenase